MRWPTRRPGYNNSPHDDAQEPASTPTSTGFLSDDPRDGSPEKPDDLGRGAYAAHLVTLLTSVREQSLSSVIGLAGDWGSGKSTVLEMLLRHLRADQGEKRWLVAEFNPWTYPDTEAMQRGFFAELKHALPDDALPGSARQAVGSFAKAISPIGSIAAIVGVSAQPIVQLAGELIAGDTSVSAAKRKAEKALLKLQYPVLMAIDDVDRLTPDELLDVLKFVRLIGRLPHVYYLLCYDEGTLLDVLTSTTLVKNRDRAKSYLEKIVQVRVDMPALRESQRTKLLNSGLDKILSTSDVQLNSSDAARLSDLHERALQRRLTAPRAINHFLGQVQAFFPTLRGEADFVDFLLVTWLRIHEPGVYRFLHEHRSALLGRTLDDLVARKNQDAASRQERWRNLLRVAQVSDENLDGVIAVLSALFPQVQAVFESSAYIASARDPQHPRAMADEDYYDRYLTFGVPDDDVSDAVVANALRTLEAGELDADVDQLTAELKSDTRRILGKFEALHAEGVQLPYAPLFRLVAGIFADVNQNQGFFTSPNRLLAGIGVDALAALPATQRTALLRSVAPTDAAALFLVETVRQLANRTQHPDWGRPAVPSEELDSIRQELAQRLRNRFENQANYSPATFSDESAFLFRAWMEFDSDHAAEWLRAGVDDGRWTLLDVLPQFVSTGWVSGGQETHAAIGEFSAEALEKIFGVEHLLDELANDIDRAPATIDSWETEPTTENRLQYALSALKRRRSDSDIGEAAAE